MFQARSFLEENGIRVGLHYKRDQPRQLPPNAPTVHREEAQVLTRGLRPTGQVPRDAFKGMRRRKTACLLGREG